MKPEYEPKNVEAALGYLVEECGEVLAAVGKTQRWGLESMDPTLPSRCASLNQSRQQAREQGSRCLYGREDHRGLIRHAFVDRRETNREWILRELDDLEGAIARARQFLGTAQRESGE